MEVADDDDEDQKPLLYGSVRMLTLSLFLLVRMHPRFTAAQQ